MSDTTDNNDTTDTNTDEPTKAELHDRVQQLESTVEKLMPSRRDALRMGAAGIAGAAGLSATTQTAGAATGSAGQIGDVNNRPDAFGDTVDANKFVTTTKTGTTHALAITGDGVPGSAIITQSTSQISTTAKTIIDAGTPFTNPSRAIAVCQVAGRELGDNSRFYDRVQYTPSDGGNVVVKDSVDVNGPDARSYSRNGRSLQLSTAANTYDVNVSATITYNNL